MRTKGRRRKAFALLAAVIALSAVFPAAALAQPIEDSQTIVVDVPRRTVSPTPTPTATETATPAPTEKPGDSPAPSPSAVPGQATGELPPTGAEAVLALIAVGAAAVAAGLIVRGAVRRRQSSTAPRS